MVMAFTLRIRGTRIAIANLAAHTIQAITCFVVRTVFVVLADAADTSKQWIALHTDRTLAIGSMILSNTFGVTATLDATEGARIYAFLVVTRFIVWTIGVSTAFGCRRKKL